MISKFRNSWLSLAMIGLLNAGMLCAQDSCENDQEECCRRLTPKFSILGYCIAAFDFDAEALFLYRCNDAKRIPFASDGVAGQIVLDSDDLHSGWQTGWRLTGKVFFDDCDRIEGSYLSGGRWFDSSSARSGAGNLYSVFSVFGTNPFGGYNGTDNASLQRISYSSEFDSWEINYLKHVSIFEIPCFCSLDGSLLFGYRHFNLDEEFKLHTRSAINDAHMDYHVDTSNSLNGLQIGAEGWIPIHERIDIGVEVKGAMYFNSYSQNTKISAPADLAVPLHEKKDDWGGSWGIEGAAKICYELCSGLYLRGGYLYLYLDDVALAVENFNKKSPFDGKRRHKKLKNSGSVTYHGATVGIDWCW